MLLLSLGIWIASFECCLCLDLSLSLAVLGPRIGRTVDNLSPLGTLLHLPHQLFWLEPGLWCYVPITRCLESSLFSFS